MQNFLEILKDSKIFGIFIYQDSASIVYTNKTFNEFLGYDHNELLGKSFYDLIDVPDKELEMIKNIAKRRTQGEVFSIELKEYVLIGKNKIKVPVSIFAYTIEYEGKPSGLVVVFNKTKEKAYEKLFFALSQINQLIIRQNDEEKLLKSVCDVLVDKVDYAFCIVGRVENKIFKPFFARAQNKDNEEELKSFMFEIKAQNICKCSASKAFYSKKVSYISNVVDLKNCMSDFFERHNISSTCAIPVVKKLKVAYIVLIFDVIPNIFDGEYLHLLNEIQQDLFFALKKIEDEKFFWLINKVINESFELVIITDKNFKVIFVNNRHILISGYTKKELLGKNIINFFAIDKPKTFKKEILDTIKNTGEFSNIIKYKLKNTLKDYYISMFLYDYMVGEQYYILIGKEIAKEDDLKEKIFKFSHFDQITGLINLATFEYSIELFLERAAKQNQIGAVIIINPIQFKNINHAFGYDVGNIILQNIAQRIKNNLRQYDIIAKLESDRFGILLKDLKTQEDTFVVCIKLLNELSKPYETQQGKISLSFNIGLSFFPDDAKIAKDLINKARLALADAKAKGENQVGFFKKEIEQESLKKLELKAELELALLNNEFIVYYQPYVDKNKKISGAESLLRWKKGANIISPGEFLPILEETYLIADVENNLFEQVLKDIKEFKIVRYIPISINLSLQSLMRKHIKDLIITNLKYHNVDESLLKIEILERAFLNDFNYIKRLIDEFRQNGIYFALDDFGTGYSSLSYLTKLNVEFLKIDISFIKDLQNDKTKNIVKSIIYLAKSLNIKTIAEGVEERWQFDTLKSMGCDYFQGYLFYKPMPKDKFFELLKNGG
ncbi:MAG: EAL domain-containing protein [Desulfurella sp.]|uniref:EAL domain-containing protein n=1 Tax=Desulfurella sp. TaxID=1962857 RepID=UPI003D0B349D